MNELYETRGTAVAASRNVAPPGTSALLLSQAGLQDRGYVCVHTGVLTLAPSARLACFRGLVQRLLDDGIAVALTGPAGQLAFAAEFRTQLRVEAGILLADFVGRTSLGTLTDLVSRARLLISDGPGATRIAATVQTPSLIVDGYAVPATGFFATRPHPWVEARVDLLLRAARALMRAGDAY
ncbi:glycosyltransferase family 9 protein [Solimonas marina]|uniref:Uncharacterized protein n=1 Tax=Solimonas marina TaxID=2714601 RepID=A0A969WEV8_9GAMM|nr:glycosyltransferase family 9 protein [Solimonas marina]NKF23475.1 hypothetical protein [Solimonas marina]